MLLALGWGGGVARAQAPVLTGTVPAANAVSQPVSGAIAAAFQAGVILPTNAGDAMRVFSAQRGGQRSGNSGLVFYQPSAPPRVLFVPNLFPFQAGETVSVSLTSAITSQAANSLPLAPPKVFEFTAATGGTGRGSFRQSNFIPGPNGFPVVQLADVDNDADLDLVGTNSVNSTVVIQLNGGTNQGGGRGNFGPATTVTVPGGVGLLAAADLDGDGDLDLLTCPTTSAAAVSVLRNNGTGTFAVVAAGLAPLDTPRTLALGDVDGDGDLDLATIETGTNTLNLYSNTGSGGFAAGSVLNFSPLEQLVDLALADVDNDYDLDLVTVQGTDVGNAGFLKVYRNGDDATGSNTGVFGNNFASNATSFLNLTPRALALGDLNGDGTLDAAVLGFNGTVRRLLNVGSGTATFGAGTAVGSAASATALALADVDADGDLDLLSVGAAGSGGGQGELVTRFNNGTAGFGTGRTASVGVVAGALALADVDGDGDVDAVAAGPNANGVGVLLNGPGPEISVRAAGGAVYPSGSTYDFGSIPVGTSTPLRLFYLKNLSPTDLLALTDFVPVGVGVTYSIPSVPRVVAPGDSIFFSFQVLAAVAGVQTGSITITNDGVGTPNYVLNFSVTGAAPVATLKTWTGAFGTAWELPSNWNPLGVPTATDDALVPLVANQPQISNTGAECANLTVQSGAVVQVNGGGYLTVGGNLDLGPFGRFAMRGGTLELRGDLRSGNGFEALGGLLTLTGGVRQRIGSLEGWNLSVGPAGAIITGNTVAVRRVLTLRGDLETQGFVLRLRSDATGTAMVVNAGGRVTNRALIERFIAGPNAGPGYRHFSSPIDPVAGRPVVFLLPPTGQTQPVINPLYNTVGNTVQPFPTLFGYNESRQGAAGVPGPVGFDQGWVAPTTLADPLLSGRGYTSNQSASAPSTALGDLPLFEGLLNTGPVAVGPLSRSGAGPFAGYHLLGNPYPSPIAWGQVAKPAGLDDVVYVFRSTGQYTGFYDFFANGLGTLPGGEIAAMQGFFVRVSQPVPSFIFTDAARLTTYSNPTFRRGPTDGRPTLALALRPAAGPAPATGPAPASDEADRAFIYFEAGATAAPDARFDAPKLPNPGQLNLASLAGGQELALNGLPPLGATPLLVPLAVATPAAGRYELAVDELRNFAPGTHLWLLDALLGTRTALRPGTRCAFALAGPAAPGRFAVEFGGAGALATAAQVLEAQVQVWPNPAAGGAGVSVAAPAGAIVAVRNALGQMVAAPGVVDAGRTMALNTAGLAAGIYVVQVRSTAGVAVVRRLVVE